MLKDQDVVHELAGLLAFHLSEKHRLNYDFEELKACVGHVDKTLFMGFRDAKITLDQLKARVAERRGFAKYKVFDDVYSDLNREEREAILKRPNMAVFLFGKKPKPEMYNRELEPWESDPKCLHSIKYHYKKGSKRRERVLSVNSVAVKTNQRNNKTAQTTVGSNDTTSKNKSQVDKNSLFKDKN